MISPNTDHRNIQAEPVLRKARVKSIEKILRQLYVDEYRLASNGSFYKKDSPEFLHKMFKFCGTDTGNAYIWRDCWFEEVE